MAEIYLQSDMLNNMGLSQQQLMFQRWNMYRNYQMGAFLSDTSGEHLAGTRVANPYLRYYAQMQRDAMEHQRRVMLQQQMMQRQMAVQQQQFMLRQQHEENQIQRSKEEADRQILEIRKLKDQVRQRNDLTQGQIDKITSDLDRKEYGLTGESEPLVKKVTRNSNFFFPEDFPNKELRGKPIPETYQVNTETGEETLLGTSGESTFNSLRTAAEQNRRFDFDQQKHRDENSQKFAEAYFKHQQLKEKQEKEKEDSRPRVLTREEEKQGKGVYIGDEAKKTLNEEAAEFARKQYTDDKLRNLPAKDDDRLNYESGQSDLRDPVQAKWDAEAERQIQDGSGKAWDLFDQHRQKKLPLDFGYQTQDTGEMFAAQDPGMEQDMFDDPGMDFDPIDETYTLDEIA